MRLGSSRHGRREHENKVLEEAGMTRTLDLISSKIGLLAMIRDCGEARVFDSWEVVSRGVIPPILVFL